MDYKKLITKPAISAGVGAVSISMLAGEAKYFQMGDKKIPLWLVGGGLGFASSFASEFVSNFILSHIPQNERLKHLESIVVHLGSSGLAFALIPKLLNSDATMSELRTFFLSGVLSEVASTFIHDNILQLGSCGQY